MSQLSSDRTKYRLRRYLILLIAASILIQWRSLAATPVRIAAPIHSQDGIAPARDYWDGLLGFNSSVPLAVPMATIRSITQSPSVENAETLSSDSVSAPTDADIFRSHAFREPLVPIGSKTTSSENVALNAAIAAYTK